MKYFIYLLAIIVLLGLNIGIFANLQVFGQMPNLLLLFTLCACLEKKNYDYFYIALISGLFLDFYSASFFGGFTLAFVLVAFLLNVLTETLVVLELNWKSLSLLLLGSLALISVVLWGYDSLAYNFHLTADYNPFKNYISALIVGFFYNCLLLYPVFIYYNFVKNMIDNWNLRRRRIGS